MEERDIVLSLRACNNTKGHRCSECPAFGLGSYSHPCKKIVDLAAAKLITKQQSEIEQLKAKCNCTEE